MPNYSKIAELLSKLPAGSKAAQKAVAAEVAAGKAAQEAAYAPHTLPTEKGNKTLAKAKKLLSAEDEARLEAEMREKGKKKFLEPSKVKERLYHGTGKDIQEFDKSKIKRPMFGEGFHLAESPSLANFYAKQWKEGQNVMPVHAAIKNPYELKDMSKWYDLPGNTDAEKTAFLKAQGFDGVKYHHGAPYDAPEESGIAYVAFEPTQIKSAIGNRGTYDVNEPDITKAHGGLIHMAEGGVPEKRDVSQLFPLNPKLTGENTEEGSALGEVMFKPKPLQMPSMFSDIGDALKSQYNKERRSMSKPGAVSDVLLRGPAAFAMGTPSDIVQMGGDALDWLQTKVPALRKPASVMDTGPEKTPPMGYAPKVQLGPEGQMPFGTEHAQDLMKRAGMTTGEERPLFEIGSALAAPFAPKAGKLALKGAKALAPTAAEMALDLAEKGGMPIRQFALPEGKLSKEEYSRMMREKYAAENAAKAAKKEAAPVTMADLKPKEEKVPADKLGFYSPAEKAAANLKRNIADGELMLSDLKKFPDVTPDELAMTGLEEWLKGKKTVTKQQVQNYMAKNKLELEEVKYEQGKGNADDMRFDDGDVIHDDDYIHSRADDIVYDWDSYAYKSRDEIRQQILEKYDPEEAEQLLASGKIDDLVQDEINDLAMSMAHDEYYENPYRRYRNDMGYEITGNDDVGYSITDPRGDYVRMNREAYDIETAEGYARQDAMDNGYLDEGETKYHDYQLPGGENYREILLKTPSRKQKLEEEIREVRHSMENPGNDPRELREMQKEIDRLENEYKYAEENAYEGSHWDEPNVIAHMRLQDRVDSEGNKILYVDEMQSDWHQEGRRAGYRNKEDVAALLQAEKELKALRNKQGEIWQQRSDRKRELAKEFADSQDPSIKAMGSTKYAEQDQSLIPLDYAYSEISRKVDDASKVVNKYKNKVPEGPFSDNWHKLALKRVMKYAADNGYTRVGFSKSQPQVNRWGTDVVAWDKADIVDPKTAAELGIPPTGWSVTATEQRGGRAGNIALEDEARARGILQENRPTTVTDRNQLYAVVAKIGRGKTEEEIQKLTDRIWKQMQEKDAGYVAPREAGMKKFYDEELEAALKKYANQFKGKYGQTTLDVPREGKQTINYIDITPDLKKSTTKGQPYKVGGAVKKAEGGAVSLDDLYAQALENSAPVSLDDLVHQAIAKNYAEGGAAYNTTPDMSDGGRYMQGEAF
jgi:hypothetical protein